MKMWLDDIRTAPVGYVHAHSVYEAIDLIKECELEEIEIEVLDLDHDLGDYYDQGGDAIKLITDIPNVDIAISMGCNVEYPRTINANAKIDAATQKRIIK